MLLSGIRSTVCGSAASSAPDSSSDEGEGGRRAGGNLSFRPIVRVGGGGNREDFFSGSAGSTGTGLARGGRAGLAGEKSWAIVVLREGKGGGAFSLRLGTEAVALSALRIPRTRGDAL